MHRPYVRLVLTLLAAGVLSFLAGVVFMETVGTVPCEGEGLPAISTPRSAATA